MRTLNFSVSWKIDFPKIEESFHRGICKRIKSKENGEILCLAVDWTIGCIDSGKRIICRPVSTVGYGELESNEGSKLAR
jgi:hypothetical protein